MVAHFLDSLGAIFQARRGLFGVVISCYFSFLDYVMILGGIEAPKLMIGD